LSSIDYWGRCFVDFLFNNVLIQVDIFRAELKRTIKDKINVMSKKMATRQEVEDTFDFLNRLLKGEKVADHQGTPICLRGREVAAQWTATFIIDTYLVSLLFGSQ
jgi:hypothetical protein